ncbi:MAG: HigA family addiction module antidote protein [Maricaulaceae bacterium]|nr:HigA family addiction module antidote protein [Maricaulaceae bacterium]
MTAKYEPIYPGEILKVEFLDPLGVSAAELARAIRVPPNRVTRVINGQAAITPDTALRLARALRTTPEFWLNLQQRFDLDMAADAGGRFNDIAPIIAA